MKLLIRISFHTFVPNGINRNSVRNSCAPSAPFLFLCRHCETQSYLKQTTAITMKKNHFILTLFFVSTLVCIHAQTPKPFVIPELKEWKSAEGTFTPTHGGRIVYSPRQPELKETATIFAKDLQLMFGISWPVCTDRAQAGDIELTLKSKRPKHSPEEYEISIDKKVKITAPNTTGIYWGTRSLLQIMEQSDAHTLPYGHIADWPDYALRGFMLDCGRKFFPIHFLRDYVKFMAYYKMNTFQIHLNDNAFPRLYNYDYKKTYSAFRLESELYPELTAQDGWYSKQDFISLQQLAEDNCVEIIPEIDIPAHSLAFSQYRPEIGSQEYGMDHLDLFNPVTYQFLDSLLTEYLGGDNPVFRGKRVHIGTDEYSNKDPKVVEKFRYFTDRYIKFVEKFGKQACIWGALTHAKGKTPVKAENVVMGVWYNNYAEPEEMIKQGYQIISIPDQYLYISPMSGNYYDYLNTQYLYNSWTPAQIGKVNIGEQHPSLLGGMFAVWNPHIVNGISSKDVHDRVFPAMQTLATKMWTARKPEMEYSEFNRRRLALSEAPGVNIAGRIGTGKVYEKAIIKPGEQLPHKEVGHDYEICFLLDGQEENKGTILFQSADATFYLADPIKGLMGFSRDGYLNTFNYRVKRGKANIRITGSKQATSLYVNGRLIDRLDIGQQFFNSEKNKMKNVRTLVFPLEQAGNFKSMITNFEVHQRPNP